MKVLNVTHYKGTYNEKEYEKTILTIGDEKHYPKNISMSNEIYNGLVKKKGCDLVGLEFDDNGGIVYVQEYGKYKIVNILFKD